ncbi:MAG: hypothetical protein ACOY4K_06305 [Pseudomonadota bacterium]
MGDHSQLLADLKAATEPSRELDCRLAIAVGGFFIDGERYGEPAYCKHDPDGALIRPGQSGDMMVPRYTASIDAAVRLARLVFPGVWWVVAEGQMTQAEPLYGCQLLFGHDAVVGEGESDADPATAVCIAIIAAFSSEGRP